MAKPGKTQISQQEIYDYLMSKPKMTRNKALGIMANIKAESDFYSDAVEIGDMKNKGIGLFQHTYPSRKKEFVEKIPDWETNWKAQIDFALSESEAQNYINTTYNTPEEAVKAFMIEFENPKDQSEEAINRRVSYSDSLNITPVAEVDVIETNEEEGNNDDVWEGEKGTKEHKAWVKKKQKQSVQMREDQKAEQEEEKEFVEEVDLEKYNANQKILKDSKFKTQEEWDAALAKAEARVKKEKNNRILIGGNYDDDGYLPGFSKKQVERAKKELAEIKEGKKSFENANNYNSNYNSDNPETPEVWEGVEGSAEHIEWERLKQEKEQSIIDEEKRKSEIKTQLKKKTTTSNSQWTTVLDAEGNEVVIPTGEDVTEAEIQENQTGEQSYENWQDAINNDENLNKTIPLNIGQNTYLWNEEANEWHVVDANGNANPNSDLNQVQHATRRDINKTAPGLSGNDADGDGIPDTIDIEGSVNQEEVSSVTNEDGSVTTTHKNGTVKTVKPDGSYTINNPNNTVTIGNPDGSYSITDPNGTVVNYDSSGTVITDPVETTKVSVVENPEVVIGEESEDEGLFNKLKTIGGGVGAIAEGVLGTAGTVLDAVGGPSAIISYVMGRKGLEAAMKEVKPMQAPELSPLFHQHLRQSKELAKRGFHPSEAKKYRKEIDNAYQIGLENSVRGTAGDRAKFLAQSGVLDAQRSSALLDFAAQDAELQRANQAKYTEQMLFKENFDMQRSNQLRTEDMQRQLADKQAAAAFTSTAFSSLMSNVGGGNSALIKQMLKGFQSGGTTNIGSTIDGQ